jgi:hypothetical protein
MDKRLRELERAARSERSPYTQAAYWSELLRSNLIPLENIRLLAGLGNEAAILTAGPEGLSLPFRGKTTWEPQFYVYIAGCIVENVRHLAFEEDKYSLSLIPTTCQEDLLADRKNLQMREQRHGFDDGFDFDWECETGFQLLDEVARFLKTWALINERCDPGTLPSRPGYSRRDNAHSLYLQSCLRFFTDPTLSLLSGVDIPYPNVFGRRAARIAHHALNVVWAQCEDQYRVCYPFSLMWGDAHNLVSYFATQKGEARAIHAHSLLVMQEMLAECLVPYLIRF